MTQLHCSAPAAASIATPAARHRLSIGWITAAASLGFAVVQLDVTIVNVALPRMGATLHSGTSALQWVVDAYALVFAALLLSAGAWSDRHGAPRTYRLGFCIFAAASLLGAEASDAMLLIAARAAQGLGAALLIPSSLAVLNHACAEDAARRARAVGIWTAAGGVSIAFGPVAGGLLLHRFGWPSIFLVNLPVCALGIFMCRNLPETPRSGHHLDLAGQLLAILALGGLITAIIECAPLGWAHPVVLGAAALTLGASGGFVLVERRQRDPMLPLGLFRSRNFSPAVCFGMAANLTYYGTVFVLSLYLQHVRGYSALQAGLAYLPLTATFIVSNVISGRMVGHGGPRRPMLIGALIGVLGFLALSRLDPHTPYAEMLLPFALIPAGMGLAVPAMTAAVLSGTPRAQSGLAAAVLNTARQAAGMIGVAMFGALVADGDARIVPGLRTSAYLSAFLLAGAWVVIHRYIDSTKGTGGGLVQ